MKIIVHKSDFSLRPVNPKRSKNEKSWCLVSEEYKVDPMEPAFRPAVWIRINKLNFKKYFSFSLISPDSPELNYYTITRAIEEKWLTLLIEGYCKDHGITTDFTITNEDVVLKDLINSNVKNNSFFKYVKSDILSLFKDLDERQITLSQYRKDELMRAIDLVSPKDEK